MVRVGTGEVGFSGNGTMATEASLREPTAVAEDVQGHIYLTDTDNHVVRRLEEDGTLSTVAGNGRQGFSGDGSSATAAELNTPTAVLVLSDGSFLIADTGNQRIRLVATDGTIHPFAGGGSSLGDGTAATQARLRKPVAIARDVVGNIYIADAADFRIRKVDLQGVITTVAGNGEQGSAGDNGPAIQAQLDAPSGIALDAAGQLYIVDRRNERVRVVSVDGTIHTRVGAGILGFADGNAISSRLAKPRSVAIDANGDLWIADTGNQRLRKVSGDQIRTVAGSGEQGVSGTLPVAARQVVWNTPMGVLSRSDGTVWVAAKGNRQILSVAEAQMLFADTPIGSQSVTQTLTLTNQGEAEGTITWSLPPGFVLQGGSCGSTTIVLAAHQSCVMQLAFAPTAAASFSDEALFSGAGFVAQRLRLMGQGLAATGTDRRISTSVSLSSGGTIAYLGDPIGLSAHVLTSQTGTPAGSVQFFDRGVLLGAAALTQGGASWTETNVALGTHLYTAAYGGDTVFAPSVSSAVQVIVSAAPDFGLQIASGSKATQTVTAGDAALFQFVVQPLYGSFLQPVTFAVQGLPAGATAMFDPVAVVPGTSPQNVLMTVKILPSIRTSRHLFFMPFALASLLFVPFVCFRRGRYGVLSLAILLLIGCGGFRGGSGSKTSPGGTVQSYPLTIQATSGALSHTLSVSVEVQN